MGSSRDAVTLFLCGDVMTGRGIDQILPHPSALHLYEPYVRSANVYVKLAEAAHGAIEKPRGFAYVWGDALPELDRMRPDARIVNLETAVTRSEYVWPGKGIHYRMHPSNVPCLTAAALDCCVLANNHTLDWGREGLEETLRVLHESRLRTAGAGLNLSEARSPARLDLPGDKCVLVFACGALDSGVHPQWAATSDRPGLWVLEDLSRATIEEVGRYVSSQRRAGDIAVLSVHWGGNWGYDIPEAQQRFAHDLIDTAGVDIVHGHSSHHPKAIEVHRGKLILYGCGDFLNDYEGIEGYDVYRPGLGLMYFATVSAATGELLGLTMTPTRVRKLRVNRADREDARWLSTLFTREGRAFGSAADVLADDTLVLREAESKRSQEIPGRPI